MKREERPRRRRGELLPDERELWATIARSVRPLPGRVIAEAMKAAERVRAEAAAPSQPPARGKERPAPPTAKPVPKKSAVPPLAPIEQRLARALRRGRTEVDARLDLHGMRQAEAHTRLRAFLYSAQRDGARIVLVITGKGGVRSPGADPLDEPGVLRRRVPGWLSDPALRAVIVGFSEADPEHGGSGALYVRLRRG